MYATPSPPPSLQVLHVHHYLKASYTIAAGVAGVAVCDRAPATPSHLACDEKEKEKEKGKEKEGTPTTPAALTSW